MEDNQCTASGSARVGPSKFIDARPVVKKKDMRLVMTLQDTMMTI